MNEHEDYMADFMHIYKTLDRWGPGSENDTLNAMSKLPFSPHNILEIGCGKGKATSVLVANSQAQITAVDNEIGALEQLQQHMIDLNVSNRVTTVCASMTSLPFDPDSFDVIWSEGSAYIMGTARAFREWKGLLKDQGVLVISDLVWFTSNPSAPAADFWEKGYPDMTASDQLVQQAEAEGYQLLDEFKLSREGWDNYFVPLNERAEELKAELEGSAALSDVQAELDVCLNPYDEFGYQILVLQKAS